MAHRKVRWSFYTNRPEEENHDGVTVVKAGRLPVAHLEGVGQEDYAKIICDSVNACRSIPKPEAIPKLVEALQSMLRQFKHHEAYASEDDDYPGQSEITALKLTKEALREAGIE